MKVERPGRPAVGCQPVGDQQIADGLIYYADWQRK
jgi:hypothetical protein